MRTTGSNKSIGGFHAVKAPELLLRNNQSKKLTEKSLEKKRHNMGTEELIQIIMSLYRSNKSVEQ